MSDTANKKRYTTTRVIKKFLSLKPENNIILVYINPVSILIYSQIVQIYTPDVGFYSILNANEFVKKSNQLTPN